MSDASDQGRATPPAVEESKTSSASDGEFAAQVINKDGDTEPEFPRGQNTPPTLETSQPTVSSPTEKEKSPQSDKSSPLVNEPTTPRSPQAESSAQAQKSSPTQKSPQTPKSTKSPSPQSSPQQPKSPQGQKSPRSQESPQTPKPEEQQRAGSIPRSAEPEPAPSPTSRKNIEAIAKLRAEREAKGPEFFGMIHPTPPPGDPKIKHIFTIPSKHVSKEQAREVIGRWRVRSTPEGGKEPEPMGEHLRPSTPPLERAEKTRDNLKAMGHEIGKDEFRIIHDQATSNSGFIAALQEFAVGKTCLSVDLFNEAIRRMDNLMLELATQSNFQSQKYRKLKDDYDDLRQRGKEKVSELEGQLDDQVDAFKKQFKEQEATRKKQLKDQAEALNQEELVLKLQEDLQRQDDFYQKELDKQEVKWKQEVRQTAAAWRKKLDEKEEDWDNEVSKREVTFQRIFDEEMKVVDEKQEKLRDEIMALKAENLELRKGVEISRGNDSKKGKLINEAAEELEVLKTRFEDVKANRDQYKAHGLHMYREVKQNLNVWGAIMNAMASDTELKEKIPQKERTLMVEIYMQLEEIERRWIVSWPGLQPALKKTAVEKDILTKIAFDKAQDSLLQDLEKISTLNAKLSIEVAKKEEKTWLQTEELRKVDSENQGLRFRSEDSSEKESGKSSGKLSLDEQNLEFDDLAFDESTEKLLEKTEEIEELKNSLFLVRRELEAARRRERSRRRSPTTSIKSGYEDVVDSSDPSIEPKLKTIPELLEVFETRSKAAKRAGTDMEDLDLPGIAPNDLDNVNHFNIKHLFNIRESILIALQDKAGEQLTKLLYMFEQWYHAYENTFFSMSEDTIFEIDGSRLVLKAYWALIHLKNRELARKTLHRGVTKLERVLHPYDTKLYLRLAQHVELTLDKFDVETDGTLTREQFIKLSRVTNLEIKRWRDTMKRERSRTREESLRVRENKSLAAARDDPALSRRLSREIMERRAHLELMRATRAPRARTRQIETEAVFERGMRSARLPEDKPEEVVKDADLGDDLGGGQDDNQDEKPAVDLGETY